MRYVAAYLLASLGGNKDPSAADVEKILSSVGIEADKTSLDKVVSELKGKNLEEVIEAGKEKLASVPSGGAPAAAEASAAGGDAGANSAAASKKEEKKEETEESDDDMGFGLFD